MIDKIQRLPLREVWKHEAYDFTTWLEENPIPRRGLEGIRRRLSDSYGFSPETLPSI